ncbi:MAG TPA: hypothetical protein VKW78_21695 [Terriglobales bacterium]|nr:hypothetical protein [Terriglobales bacterium]
MFMGVLSPSPMKILQRCLMAAITLVAVSGLLSHGWAQSIRKKTSKGPRAVAILEWGAKGPRLIPVSIMVDGKFYDAGIYLADPVPMALDPGNVYEVQKSGDPAGLFTINSVMQEQNGPPFYGIGKFTTQAEVQAAANKAAAAKAKAAERASRHNSDDSGPPRLRRAHSAPMPQPGPNPPSTPPGTPPGMPPGAPPMGGPPIPQTSPPPSSGPTGTGDDSGGDRPTMKRPKQTSSPSSTPDDTGDDSDTERPTLKKQAPTAPPSVPPAATNSSNGSTNDSDRPVLKRGTEGRQAESIKGPASPVPSPSAPKGMNRTEVAVSDPNIAPPHPFKWVGSPDVEKQNEDGTRQLALQAVRDYAVKHPGARPGSTLQDVEVREFDLDFSNEAVVVLSATVPQESATPSRAARRKSPGSKSSQEVPTGSASPKTDFYVTVVARQNYDGTMRKVFALATDGSHLDVYPRLELIDAVDADGSGRGELLFRQISDSGTSYAIYRVGVETMTALYNSGAPLQQ